MPVNGAAKVKANVGRWVAEVQGNTEKVLTSIAMTGAGYAKLATPVDTATLINSQYYTVNGDRAIIGYSAGFSDKGFNYGLFLHENVYKDGSPVNWKPLKKKAATHHFLSDAFESPEYRADYNRIIINGYRL